MTLRGLGTHVHPYGTRAGPRQAQVGRQWLIAIEQGRPGAEIGLLLRTLTALRLQLGVDDGQTEKPAANPKNARPAVDLDAIIDRARGRKP
jgi:HTH-type transcriptional regulator/antitoxin HipB